MARFWDVNVKSSACPKKPDLCQVKNWIFWFWGYICSFAFCKINGNQEKRVIAYGISHREKWGRKLICISDFAWDFYPALLLIYYLIITFAGYFCSAMI